MMESTLKRTWAEIDLDALAHNYRVLCDQMGKHSRFLGVVKADAYGHGAVQVGKVLEELGAGYLAVSNINEACELRHMGICLPILQLGVTPVDQTRILISNQVTQTVYNEISAQRFSAAAVETGRTLCVHIKLDTGMSRLGFQCDEANFARSLDAICRVHDLPGLVIEGIFTHFAVSDEDSEESRSYTMMQHERFVHMVETLEQRGIRIPIHHCANSGATVDYPQFGHDMFRPGILTYGIGEQAPQLGLRPVMTLKTTIGVVTEYEEGISVSYGRDFQTQRPSRIGVLPIGYADGLPRGLSKQWSVWTPYGSAPIVGRICMDMCMVDLTDLPEIHEGDEVEVYGVHNSVNEAARVAGTIPYELTVSINKRVPRIYYRGGQQIYRELLLRG